MAYCIYEDLIGATEVKIHLKSCIHYVNHEPTETTKWHEVVFLSKKSNNPNLAALQKSVSECVEKKNYDFKTAKISNEGKVTFE